MNEEKKYFKQPGKGEFIKASFSAVIPLTIVIFLGAPFIEFIKWQIERSGPFVLFPSTFDIAFYCLFIFGLLAGEFWYFRKLYYRMRKTPFLVITRDGICMEPSLLPHHVAKRGGDKIKLEWPCIQRVEVEKERLLIFFEENGKQKLEKIDLRLAKEKKDLLNTLKADCESNKIFWIEKG